MRISLIYILLIVLINSMSSCTDRSVEIYIDAGKEAIISCNGNPIHEVAINGPDSTITYNSLGYDTGADTIHFNKMNSAFRITISYDNINNSYILKLKPNSSYEVRSRSRNGDQGPFRLIFKTNDKGRIIDEVENQCR